MSGKRRSLQSAVPQETHHSQRFVADMSSASEVALFIALTVGAHVACFVTCLARPLRYSDITRTQITLKINPVVDVEATIADSTPSIGCQDPALPGEYFNVVALIDNQAYLPASVASMQDDRFEVYIMTGHKLRVMGSCLVKHH